ncbi:MAG TPA: hypothetical protein VMU62_03515 [Acidobacteriaceae bacterium]|nr:hypothetical protein [Acidobacteriaceae bacterium]
MVISCGGNGANVNATSIYNVCNNVNANGVGSIVDFSGDSLLVRVDLGNGPRWIGLNSTLNNAGFNGYTANADGTINTFSISTTLETNQVDTSTLLPNANPSVLLSANGDTLYVVEQGRNSIAVMTSTASSSVPAVQLEIPITDPQNVSAAQNPVNLVGNSTAQRIYAIAQGPNAPPNAPCPSSAGNGSITAIETGTSTISAVIPSGVCPIYGIMSADNRRTFVLNQGSGTITVIDSQQNQLDQNPNLTNGTIAVGQGPVWADLYNTGSILAVVNSQSNTLSLINVSLDSFGNDSPNFGQIIATVPVGKNPTSVAILQDGSRAYVANHDDGTVSVVSLVSNQVLKTIPVAGHPISIAATTGTPTGKVYVVSPDSDLMTIIRTDNDTVANSLQLTGAGVQVRVTAP